MSSGRNWKEWNKAWRKKPVSIALRTHGLRYRIRRIKDNPQRAVRNAEPWGILAAAVGLILAVATFWVDYSDKIEERTVRAWQLVTTTAPGNSGKREALEYLNSEHGWCFLGACKRHASFTGIDLSLENGRGAAYLYEVNLSGADLFDANLSGADLSEADFSNADLIVANLSGADLLNADLSGANMFNANPNSARLNGANLGGANLTEANLCGADLSGANLYDADLSEVDFSGADLSYVDLSGAIPWHAENLEQDQLNEACGDAVTRGNLPDGLTVPHCSEVDWYENVHGNR